MRASRAGTPCAKLRETRSVQCKISAFLNGFEKLLRNFKHDLFSVYQPQHLLFLAESSRIFKIEVSTSISSDAHISLKKKIKNLFINELKSWTSKIFLPGKIAL